MSRALRIAPLLLCCGLTAAALPPAEAPAGLPEGVAPLPAESSERLQELLDAAVKYRGLPALRPVPAGTLEEPELRRKVLEAMEKDLSKEELAALQATAEAFGLIPKGLDLGRYLPELLTSEVAGFYDPEQHYLALVRRGNTAEEANEDGVLVHELTHALQDQHFHLEKFESSEPLSDGGTARSALVEGDAMLTMMSFLAGTDVARSPELADAMRRYGDDPGLLGPSALGGDELAKAPAWIRDVLLFDYFRGLTFCLEVRRAGGSKLLDHAFAADPPRSSEQILHPEKWFGPRRDDPVALRWPDLSALLPGYRKAAEGEVGEATVRTLLREGGRDREAAAGAAAGWGGDRFGVYEKDGRRLLLWWTEWDSAADAREFLNAARKLGSGWRVDSLSPRRVLAVRGDLTRKQRSDLRASFTRAEAVMPENKPVDRSLLLPPASR